VSSRPACPYCGSSVSAEARYCDHCGTPLARAAASIPSRRQLRQQLDRVPVWLFVLIIFGALVSSSVSGFRYTAGYWPLTAAPASAQPEPEIPVLPPPPAPVGDKEVAEYRRAVVSINVRGAQGIISGSGFMIDSKGNVVTAAHVVEGAEMGCITVTDDNGRTHPAALVQKSRITDVALLRVPTMVDWPAQLPLLDETSLKRGDQVYVVGSPKGAGSAVRLAAEVDHLRLSLPIDGRYYPNLIQTSGAVVIQGTSGGPLVSKSTGEVAGIIIASGSNAPLAWALPISDVIDLVRNWTTLSSEAPCSSEPAARTVPVTLAAITPRSGAYGAEGADLSDGVALALRDMEDDLRAVGYEVKLRTYDDQNSVASAREAGGLAAHDPSVIGVVGSLDSAVTYAIAEALLPSGLVLVAPTAGAEELTASGWQHVNRLVASAQRQEQAAVRFARDRLGARAVFMVEDGTTGADRQARTFEAGAQVIALPVVGKARTPIQGGDYSDLVQRIKESKADAIYYAGGSDSALRLISAVRKESMTIPIFSGQSLFGPSFEAMIEPYARHLYFSRLTAEPSEQFHRHFDRMLGKQTRGYAVYGYDAASVILAALVRYGEQFPAQVPTREELAALVRQTKGHHGHASWISFDSQGENVTSWIYFYEWRQGLPEPQGSLY
jgi:branched-chain amino acid transport system substrate-binding protein